MHHHRLFLLALLAIKEIYAVVTTSNDVSNPESLMLSSPPLPSIASDSGLNVASTSALNSPYMNPTSTPPSLIPYPTPTQTPVSDVFPETDPSDPPEVGSRLIPDFGPAWASAYGKAKAMVASLSLEQKVNVTTGVGWTNGRCVGNIPPIGEWKGLCLGDGPLGVRFADFVTAFPAGINAAATFSRKLIRDRAIALGEEHVAKGINVALGPGMNFFRVAQFGRGWEHSGGDSFLAAEASYETVLGLQKTGVQACAKHLLNAEQEHFRETFSANVDQRTQQEIYLQPFLRSVMAGAASIMCSYNLINNTYACENSEVMNDMVKHQLGFQGYIISDWVATHSTMSAMAGLDMNMPGDVTYASGNSYFGANLTAYVRNGSIPEARLDDMATRILTGWYFLKQDAPTYPSVNFDAFRPLDESVNEHVDVQENHREIARDVAKASVVMLKNENGALPLCTTKSCGDQSGKKIVRTMVLVGSDAGPAKWGPNGFSDRGGIDGVLAMGWGSGTSNFSYLVSPLEAIQARAREDHTSLTWTLDDYDVDRAGNYAVQKNAAIVFVHSNSGEFYITVDGNVGDRNNLTAWNNGDKLVLAVAAQNENTIVVVHSVGPLIVEPWIDHPNVTAVLWAGLGGQEAGNAIADVLYGDWNPSGKLPYTIAKRPEDYPAQLITNGSSAVGGVQIDYSEGLEIDYRHFDAKKIVPRFEFGFGKSYTTFKYDNLVITKADTGVDESVEAWEAGKAGPHSQSQGASVALWLHRPAYEVTFDITNTGGVYGCEAPQLYLNHPPAAGEPPAILKGFDSVNLGPGETKNVHLTLSRYDLSIWSTVQQAWVRSSGGDIGVTVGASSRDSRLHGHIAA